MSNTKNNAQIMRRKYFWNGKDRNYVPDFIVDGIITEIKGYKTEQWMAKLKDNPDVRVLYGEDLQPILQYVIMMYGKDFTKLYGSATVLESGTVLKTVR